jgi:hypothetical protein
VKKVGDLFEELGFRKDGSDGVKRAFIENLVKAAAQTPLKTPLNTPIKEEQLSFDFESLESGGPETPFPTRKRSAG